MVVKPRISVRSASALAARKTYPTSAVIAADNGRPAKSECQCASIRPGMMTRPPQSMTCAPSGGGGLPAMTSLMRPPSTRTHIPSRIAPARLSKTRTLVKTTGRGGSGACAPARLDTASVEVAAAIPPMKLLRDRSAPIRRVSDWISGRWQRHPTDPAASGLSTCAHDSILTSGPYALGATIQCTTGSPVRCDDASNPCHSCEPGFVRGNTCHDPRS